jgi:hypothetical protein
MIELEDGHRFDQEFLKVRRKGDVTVAGAVKAMRSE